MHLTASKKHDMMQNMSEFLGNYCTAQQIVKTLLETKGLTQAALAKLAGVDPRTISKALKGGDIGFNQLGLILSKTGYAVAAYPADYTVHFVVPVEKGAKYGIIAG
jgi:predicted transcriptional regulator